MEILQMVESARRAKSPIVGIPQPGERPFCIRRGLLIESLRGLKIIDAAIQLPLDPKGQKVLVVYATGPRVQAIRRFVPAQNWGADTRIINWDWAEAQRKTRSKPKIRTSARGKQIARLEKKLAKLGTLTAPKHPLLYRDRWHESLQEYDAKELAALRHLQAEGSCLNDVQVTLGQRWARWKREARVRRWIQAQARECKAGKITTTQLYARLRERGLKVRTWSELNTHERERCERTNKYEGVFGYLAILWEFCGIAGKVRYWFDPIERGCSGAEHYKFWLEGLRDRKELLGMIENLKELEGV